MRRRAGLHPAAVPALDAHLPGYAPAVARRIAALSAARFIPRMFRGDPSLWSSDRSARRAIRNRLAWLRSPERMLHEAPRLESFAARAAEEGMRHVVLLGMGGSSLCVEVFRRVFPAPRGFPRLVVLDSTVPAAVRRVEGELDLSRTLFVVSSKSGTTLETLALQSYFWAKARRARGRMAQRHFVAITDPGTPLSAEAAARGYRATFHNDPGIGGRYSALSYFGLVPAVLGGVDIAKLLERAVAMLDRCGPNTEASDNPGLALGAALGVLALRGRDKVLLAADPALESFGLWIEQLLAESTGKDGRGLVPVGAAGPAAVRDGQAGRHDGVSVILALGNGHHGRPRSRDRPPAGTPTIVLTLRDRHDVGASMLQWEIATAVAGAVLGVNPFDEPNVAESKKNTEEALETFETTGRLAEGRPALLERKSRVFLSGVRAPAGRRATLASALKSLLARRRRGDYVAVLAYVDPGSRPERATLLALRSLLTATTRCAVTLGYGPRYLHSTGQLHKGGPGKGLFVEIAPADRNTLPIPGRRYDFETLKQAQALGDYLSLKRRKRRALRILSEDGAAQTLRSLLAALRRAAASGRARA